jgi:adenylate cyclase
MIGRLVRSLEFSVYSSVATYTGFEIGSSNQAAVFCLRGWALLQQTHNPSVWHRARACFEQALAMDPDSADAKIGAVIVSLGFKLNFWDDPRQEDEARLEQLLVEAIDCGGLSGRALLATGMLRRLQDRMPESKMALQVAIASDPSDAWAIRQFGYTLAHTGETEAAAVELEKSLRLNPYDGGVAGACQMLGHCHLLLDDPESSIQYFRASIARNPWLVSTHAHLAAALASSRELSEARATVGRTQTLKPEWRSVAAIRRSLPYTNPRYLALMNDGFFAGLRRAGMPEQ